MGLRWPQAVGGAEGEAVLRDCPEDLACERNEGGLAWIVVVVVVVVVVVKVVVSVAGGVLGALVVVESLVVSENWRRRCALKKVSGDWGVALNLINSVTEQVKKRQSEVTVYFHDYSKVKII